jgi:hypothetical protein
MCCNSTPSHRPSKQKGQGVIEYAGAMIVAALIVVSLTTGMQKDQWMYEAYEAIYQAAGNNLEANAAKINQ